MAPALVRERQPAPAYGIGPSGAASLRPTAFAEALDVNLTRPDSQVTIAFKEINRGYRRPYPTGGKPQSKDIA